MNKTRHARRQAVVEQCNVSPIEADLVDALRTVRQALDLADDTPEDHAMCAIETFAAVALHVLKRCPPALIRNAAQVIEIRARMDGVPVLTTTEERAS